MKAFLLAVLLVVAPLASADSDYPPQSIYNLNAKLIDQSGAVRGLDMHRGNPVLVTMFYGSCPLACPMLIDTLRSFERSLTPAERARIRVVLISIDPERDTTESLRALATTRRINICRGGRSFTLTRPRCARSLPCSTSNTAAFLMAATTTPA